MAPPRTTSYRLLSLEDHDGEKVPVSKDAEQEQKTAQDSTEAMPGALPPAGLLLPFQTGTLSVGVKRQGSTSPFPEGEEKDKAILSQFIHEQFYGEWYHNAAVIVAVGPLWFSSLTRTLTSCHRL
ncbi:hypothetical protein FA13DRAFT_956071 [Coprinellus micaceus]|uniref:Uncharacterized protein n=1 Tax=Coprinellus micaceus TaxID=71717 RepID=A0A4Y7RXI0_COPMI|nr:hypothetical protein FA13DRAFT_956071 [Coprinellus micaceus]